MVSPSGARAAYLNFSARYCEARLPRLGFLTGSRPQIFLITNDLPVNVLFCSYKQKFAPGFRRRRISTPQSEKTKTEPNAGLVRDSPPPSFFSLAYRLARLFASLLL